MSGLVKKSKIRERWKQWVMLAFWESGVVEVVLEVAWKLRCCREAARSLEACRSELASCGHPLIFTVAAKLMEPSQACLQIDDLA